MSYEEGIVAVIVCVTVVFMSLFGAAIYYFDKKSKQREERRKEDGIKIMFLIDNLIDILNSKYDDGRDDNRK